MKKETIAKKAKKLFAEEQELDAELHSELFVNKLKERQKKLYHLIILETNMEIRIKICKECGATMLARRRHEGNWKKLNQKVLCHKCLTKIDLDECKDIYSIDDL